MKRSELLALAVAQIGKTSAEQLKWYPAAAGTPSCAMGVSWLFDKLGATKDIGGKWAYAPYFLDWAKKNGKFTKTPQPGYPVFFDWEPNGTPNHVGIVESVQANGNLVCIELNGGDRQKWERLTRNKAYAMGFCAIDFVEAATPAPEPPKPAPEPVKPPVQPDKPAEPEKPAEGTTGALKMGDKIKLAVKCNDLVTDRPYFAYVYNKVYVLMEDPAADGSVAFSPTGRKPATGRQYVKNMTKV